MSSIMGYKNTVQQIIDLPWSDYSPLALCYTGAYAALEFAESLRCALDIYQDEPNLQKMARGELQTSNLAFKGYQQRGDHSEFLWYFLDSLKSSEAQNVHTKVQYAWKKYHGFVESLSASERAMTVFSREHELPGIFTRVLASHPWEKNEFDFYGYYLERHIALDSEAGGHGELVKKYPLDLEVLAKFYRARYDFYIESCE